MTSSVPPPGGPLLEIRNLTVRYGKATACDDVSFQVAPGSVYALLGRNGAGKSSLVRCALGEQKADSGSPQLFGEDVWKHRARLLSRVGVVPEEPDAPAAMTARHLEAFCRELYPRWDSVSFNQRLERFGVPQQTPFGRLSKGQKGQVLLALALAPSPDLLVLDDPTLGLDVVARRAFWEELMGELADRGTTVFLTTHDLAAIEGIATRVGILKEGRLVLDEEVETLKSRFRKIRYGNRITETRTEFGTELDAFESVRVKVRGWGIEAVVSNWDEGAFETFRRQDGVEGAESSAMSLEDIFFAVAGEPRGAEKNGGTATP
ncbi:MAG TPA: ABC transporter ATP-binding protein [Thermoanaerobaculia bacterium]|nr:ABC transporter ATP-binding protein [Thermoanaerobaculia bacterium]